MIKSSFDEIVPTISTLTPNILRNLTIRLSHEPRHWQTSSDQVGHPLDDAILARGKPSVVVSIQKAKHNRVAFWSKIFQRYFPRLHENKLLQFQCSSGAYDMCTPSFKAFVIDTLHTHRIFRRGVPPRSR